MKNQLQHQYTNGPANPIQIVPNPTPLCQTQPTPNPTPIEEKKDNKMV